MKKYLIVNRISCNSESKGFERDGSKWVMENGVSIKINDNIELFKPIFSKNPLFYSWNKDFFICSDSWLETVKILKNYGFQLNENLEYLYEYLMFQCPLTDRTFCKEISYLRSGETVRINSGDDKSSIIGNHQRSEIKEFHLAKTLMEEIALVDPERTFFHLSSGLDSSILAILASRVFKEYKIKTASFVAKGKGGTQELSVIKSLSRDFNLQLELLDIRNVDIFSAGQEMIRLCLGYPVAHPSHLTRFLLDRGISEKADIVVTGRGIDECLGGYAWHQPEFSDFEKYFNRLCATEKDCLDKLIRKENGKTYNYADGFNGFFNSRNGNVLTLSKRLDYDLLTISEAWNIIDSAFEQGLGIRYFNPFMKESIIEMFYSLDDSEKVYNGLGKIFLRNTFKNDYPEYVLKGKKYGLTFDMGTYMADYPEKVIMDTVYSHSEFSNKHIDKNRFHEMVKNTIDGSKNFGWQIWEIFLCGISYQILKA